MQYHQVEPWSSNNSSYYMRRVTSNNSTSTHHHGMIMEEDHHQQMERAIVMSLASQSAVVMFSISSCCMCHAMKRLFCGMGVNPTVHELDLLPNGKHLERALMNLLLGASSNYSTSHGSVVVPLVFIGGKLVGSMDRVLAFHINGTLVPLLKDAGALWL